MADTDPLTLVRDLFQGTRETFEGCFLEDETFGMIKALGAAALPALEVAILDERNLAEKIRYDRAVVLYTELAATHVPVRLVEVAKGINPVGRAEMARVLGWKEVAQLSDPLYQELIQVFQSEPPVYRQWIDNLIRKRQLRAL
jgi:hypothetical protein